MGIVVGLVAMVGTIALALRWRGVTSWVAVAGQTATSLLGIALLAAAGLGLYWMMQPHALSRNGPTPLLEYQVKAPAGVQWNDPFGVEVHLDTPENRADGAWNREKTTEVEGARVWQGYVQMYYRTSGRLLVLHLPNREDQIFRLRLPSNPMGKKYRTWSEWRRADFGAGPERGPGPLDAGKSFLVRYQVETYE